MLAHLTTGSESSLLRSPKASEGEGGALGEAEALKRGNTVGVRDQVMDLVAGQGLKVSRVTDNDLMPTPNTMDGLPARSPEKIAESKERTPGGYANLRETVVNEIPVMLPTPVVNDMGAGKTPEVWDEWTAKTREKHKNGNGHGPSLNIEMLRLVAVDKENDVSVSDTNDKGL